MLKRLIKWLGQLSSRPKPILNITLTVKNSTATKIVINNKLKYDQFGYGLGAHSAVSFIQDYLVANNLGHLCHSDQQYWVLYSCINTTSPRLIELEKVNLDVRFTQSHQIQL